MSDHGGPTVYSDFAEAAKLNASYRRVGYTDPNMQVVLMSLGRGQIIPLEQHRYSTQMFRVESGTMELVAGKEDPVSVLVVGDTILVPPCTAHEVRNIGSGTLKLSIVYSPPQHPANTIDETPADAAIREERAANKIE